MEGRMHCLAPIAAAFLLAFVLTTAVARAQPADTTAPVPPPSSGPSDTGEKIKQDATEAGAKVKAGATEAGEKVKAGATTAGEKVKQGATDVGEKVKKGATEVGQKIKRTATEALDSTKKAVGTGSHKAHDAVTDHDSAAPAAGDAPN